MAINFFDPVQDIADLDFYKLFNFQAAWLIHIVKRGAFHFAKDSGNFGRKGPFQFTMTRILGVTSGGVPLI